MPLNTKPECVRNIEKACTEVGGGVVDLSALHLLIKELLKKASGATPREEACLHPLWTTAG